MSRIRGSFFILTKWPNDQMTAMWYVVNNLFWYYPDEMGQNQWYFMFFSCFYETFLLFLLDISCPFCVIEVEKPVFFLYFSLDMSSKMCHLQTKLPKKYLNRIVSRKMEPAWEKTCGSNFRLTSRTIVQPNGGTREVPCYQLTKTECLCKRR